MVAICPQRPEFLKKMREKHGLTFPVLRDLGNRYAEKLGLRFELPEYLREVYLSFPVDLERLNEDPSWSLAMPTRLVVDRQGVVAAAEYDPDYTRRPEPEQTLEVLRTLS